MKTVQSGKFICLVLITFLSIVAWTAYYRYSQLSSPQILHFSLDSQEVQRPTTIKASSNLHDKWIVVTSISHPTADVRYLARLAGWKVVVVGDIKTPKNWRYRNVTFLSIDEQKNLGYRITAVLPYNSYSRKTIGYLYAIAHGAKVIYDTDDDNRPLGFHHKLNGFDLGQTTKGLIFSNINNNTIHFNPYSHFTKEDIWPRGFPLESIGLSYNAHRLMCSQGHVITPIIQQGLVNGDPDVDAIFRLTRLKKSEVPKIMFDATAPPLILQKGVFAPFNSQNTLLHYKAFWSLVLPVTTTFRVCDIWRSYWAQVLLWLIGGNLGFYSPNAIQKRNPHSNFRDFEEESKLYSDAGRMTKFLSDWNCLEINFFECVKKLSNDMVQHDFLKYQDEKLIKLWLQDLIDAGYEEPVMQNQPFDGFTNVKNCNLIASFFNPPNNGMDLSFQPARFKNVDGNNSTLFTTFHDILLVIVFNFPFFEVIPMLETMYNAFFPQILYCGYLSEASANNSAISQILKKVTFVNSTNTYGYFGYECFLLAVEMGFRVNGYLVMSDDVLLNAWNLVGLNQSNIWYYEKGLVAEIPLTHSKSHSWQWWAGNMGRKAVNSTLTDLKHIFSDRRVKEYLSTLRSNVRNESDVPYSWSDIYFVPKRLANKIYKFGSVFRRENVFLEIAVPMLLMGFSLKEERELLLGKYLTYPERGMNVSWYNESLYFLHPFKLSQISINRNLAVQLDQYFRNVEKYHF